MPSYGFAPASLQAHPRARQLRLLQNQALCAAGSEWQAQSVEGTGAPTPRAGTRPWDGKRWRASPRALGESPAAAVHARRAREWMERSISRAWRGQPMTRPGAAAGRCARAAAWRRARAEQPAAAAASRGPPAPAARPPPPWAPPPAGLRRRRSGGDSRFRARQPSAAPALRPLRAASTPPPPAHNVLTPPEPAARIPGLRPPHSLRKWQTPGPFLRPVPPDWTPHTYSHPLPRSHPG